MIIIWFGMGIIVGLLIGKLLASHKQRLAEMQNVPTEEDADQIMALFDDNPQITNQDIRELLGVSAATATRYMDGLEEQGIVTQQGKTGRSTFYTRN